jgi:hypothetical protein
VLLVPAPAEFWAAAAGCGPATGVESPTDAAEDEEPDADPLAGSPGGVNTGTP